MAFETRKSLLFRVKNGDEFSWNEFYELYSPLIRLHGGDFNLNEEEKDELVQKVMCEIFQKDILSKYSIDQVPEDVVYKHDPNVKGRFRHYMRAIIGNHARAMFKKRNSSAVSIDDPDMPDVFSEEDISRKYEEEYRMLVLNDALKELKNKVESKTFAAFEMCALQNRPPKEVAEFLNISIESVYTNRSRCVKTLKEIVKSLEEH